MSRHDMTPEEREIANDLRRRTWAKDAPRYDKQIGFFERRVFGSEHRRWACSRATGDTLEVAIGTGLNLSHYPADVRLTGLDLSPEMLALARERASKLGRSVDLREGDAQELPFPADTFDTVVCTYSLCNVPDERQAILEMKRVLRRGGRVILVDHIRSSAKPIFWLQKMVELFSIRSEGEHATRRPFLHVEASGFDILERDRMRAGVVERLVAVISST
jgi:ubiquinone/menaquinone biosynthesis C-methylase UbiE